MQKGRIAALLLAGAMIASTLIGCTGSKTTQGGTSAGKTTEAGKEKPLEINIMVPFYSNEPCPEDDPVKKKIEENTNTILKIQWVAGNNWEDKLNITLASGELPDMLQVDLTNPLFLKMAQKGAFWEIKPSVNAKDHPSLSALPDSAWAITSIGGKNYGVPTVATIGGEPMPFYRDDWRKKLGLKVPETMQDLYVMMKAFTEQDPDGNGKKDTFGLSGNVGVENMDNFHWIENVFTHSTQRYDMWAWKVVDDKVVNSQLLPGVKDALVWLSNAYKEGLIPQDFAVIKSSQYKEYATKGKAGIASDTLANAWRATDELRKAGIKEADFVPVSYMISSEGKKYAPYQIDTKLDVFPKTIKEDKFKRILKFMDFTRSKEGHRLAKYGFEGQHYVIENDEIKALIPEKELKSTNLSQFFTFYDKYNRARTAGLPKENLERNMKIIDTRLEVAVQELGKSLMSDTEVKIKKDLGKRIQDVKTKIIMGKEPITAWDDMVRKLQADPDFIKMTEEKNQAYKEMQKK